MDGGAEREWLKCSLSCEYFIDNYIYIYDATDAVWLPFKLWPKQREALETVVENRLTIILKARQLGMTWMVLAVAIWLMIFHPSVTVLVFSRRDDEATYLLERMRGMYKRLPDWMKVRKIPMSNAHIWSFSNGSIAYGFPTTAGDSYTASLAIVDEADLVPDLEKLMNAVKPTIDGGGKMILLSRSNKDDPESSFKRRFRAAMAGKSPWAWVFLPWFARPTRTQQWYEDQKADSLTSTGSLDDLYQQYPSTPEEALMARTLNKRFPPQWLQQCYVELEGEPGGIVPGLQVFRWPDENRPYVIGADPAEGNPTSDDSSLHVLDGITGEEVAHLADKIEPTIFAQYIQSISEMYNNAPVLVERNNHGHAVIGYLNENTAVDVLEGWNGNEGWLTSTTGKALLWTTVADRIRDQTVMIHSSETLLQLSSIEGGTLRAPKGSHDDRAVSYGLAVCATDTAQYFGFAYNYVTSRTDR